MTLFNISPSLVYNSLDPGSTTLSAIELIRLQDGFTNSNGVNISSPMIISVISELFNRYEVSRIRYYFSGSGTVSIYTSQNKDVWDEKSVVYGTGYAEVSASSLSGSFPKFVKVTHNISTSATIYEVEVLNNEQKQGYWYNGLKDELDVDSNEESEPSEVQVFNKSGVDRDFYCFIDVNSSVDFGGSLKLGLSESGPFYGKYERGIKSNRDYLFSSGVFSGTVLSGTSVILNPSSGTGYYYSPVFDVSAFNPLRLFTEFSFGVQTSVDWVNNIDSDDTIAFRLLGTPPNPPWVSGLSPDSDDPIWGSISGSLPYKYAPNNAIIDINIGQYRYLQFAVRLNSDIIGQTPILSSLGVEESLKISDIPNQSYKVIYAKTDVDGYSFGDSANVLTFFTGV